MKALSILAKPFIIIIAFCFLLISGESFGGFYLLYILLGLPHGALHSLVGLLGVGLLIISSYRFKQQYQYMAEPVINIGGVVLMILSLYLFFVRDSSNYNFATFKQILPLCLLGIFGLLIVNFLVVNLIRFYSREST